jgi:hypothetical protein
MLTFSLWFLLFTGLDGSTPDYEQLTADYFFDTIWKQRYKDYRSIEFDHKTDTSSYLRHVYGCGKWTNEDKKEIVEGKTQELVELNSRPTNTLIKKRSGSNRLKLMIASKIRLGDTYVVEMAVYKPFEFVDHYFIKFDKTGKIIDRCEFNEII